MFNIISVQLAMWQYVFIIFVRFFEVLLQSDGCSNVLCEIIIDAIKIKSRIDLQSQMILVWVWFWRVLVFLVIVMHIWMSIWYNGFQITRCISISMLATISLRERKNIQQQSSRDLFDLRYLFISIKLTKTFHYKSFRYIESHNGILRYKKKTLDFIMQSSPKWKIIQVQFKTNIIFLS